MFSGVSEHLDTLFLVFFGILQGDQMFYMIPIKRCENSKNLVDNNNILFSVLGYFEEKVPLQPLWLWPSASTTGQLRKTQKTVPTPPPLPPQNRNLIAMIYHLPFRQDHRINMSQKPKKTDYFKNVCMFFHEFCYNSEVGFLVLLCRRI
jgi:hypothetical protein